MGVQSVNWGYILAAPGRPSERKQLAFMASAGINTGQFGPVWRDYVKRGSTRPQHQLEARNDVIGAAQPGDTIHVHSTFCLGLSATDARWFMASVISKGVKLLVDGKEVSGDSEISRQSLLVGQMQNRHHVRVSRGHVEPDDVLEAPLPKKPRRKWPDGPCVYRLFDADGRLLWIGCTQKYRSRRYQHRSTSAFGKEIAQEEVVPFKTMRAALDEERRAIWHEKPIYNTRRLKPKV
ncbi:MAG: hypothetical protein CMF72_22690 [Mameliella sp.]|nr:hypothetical protein [Mameliella sp.]|tara:strand:- start:1197 stop:1904 length:708 start_codon:yes stop_codon:yes gene_type:complete